MENRAPNRKHSAVIQLPRPRPMAINRTTTKIARILYSAKRKAFAPSLMAAAISFMRSVPASCLETNAIL